MMGYEQTFAGLLLAGGSSTRFGSDKRGARLDGEAMLGLTYRTVCSVVEDVNISVGDAGDIPEVVAILKDADRPVSEKMLICDIDPKKGPLGGIYSAMTALDSDWLLVLAVDLPRITSGTLRALIDRATPRCSIVVAVDEKDRIQPLAGCYNRRILPYIEHALREKRCGMKDFLDRVAMAKGGDHVVRLRVPKVELLNVNFPEDLEGEQQQEGQYSEPTAR
jgi:molybdopterin-guanine dinucleotide biosynthesis protein A